jgi:3-phosphoshikimate 1-carboxyvinyltransferase
MIAKICKSELSGTAKICPSKSFEQRAWAMSALPGTDIKITNSGNSDDAKASKKIAEKLKDTHRSDNVFDCGESALCARMYPPIIALHTDNFILDGHGTLLNRNIRHDLEFYEQTFGWKISDGGFPIRISNAHINSGKFNIDGSHTSQIISGLMLALSNLESDSQISVWNPTSTGYIIMTAGIADEMGAKISAMRNDFFMDIKIYGNASLLKKNLAVEGDWSNAAFLIAAGLANGDIEIAGLNPDSMQPDRMIHTILFLCGANYEWKKGKLIIHKSQIHGFEFDAQNYPDLIPPLCAMALNADSECIIKGTNRLIGKESNRLEAIVTELGKLGANIRVTENCLAIQPCRNIGSATVDSHNDHRIAMMLATIGLSSNGIQIANCECVSKSYPEFFDVLKHLGGKVE